MEELLHNKLEIIEEHDMTKARKTSAKGKIGDSETPRRRCPSCGDLMQKSGQKVDSNHVVKQRYLCTECKKKGRTPYNHFITIRKKE